MRPTKPKAKTKKCATCGKLLPAIRRSDMRYCSPRCKVIGWARRTTGVAA